MPQAADIVPEVVAEVLSYAEHFQRRVLQDALNEATAGYWTRRAEQFERVGNTRCAEIAAACRNRAAVALLDVDHPDVEESSSTTTTPPLVICPTCGTPTSPWTCSCGRTRVGGAA